MAVKRKRSRQTVQQKTVKRLREEEATGITTADRLTELPEHLQLHILSFLQTKHAVQTLALSKSWASQWSCLPVLNFISYGFKKLHDFDKFVFNRLSLRQSVKLEKLSFTRSGTCSTKVLKKVFDYAFSNGVKELDASVICSRKDSWPIPSRACFDSLKSLTLDSNIDMCCPILGPKSESFKNINSLCLRRVIIGDLDPFSGFAALKKLTLVACRLQTDGNTLNVHALHLTELIISYYGQNINRCKLKTPKLRFFECRGNNFPLLITHQGGVLPVLDTAVIDYNGFCSQDQEKKMFDDVMMMFNALRNVKSLTVFSAVVDLLSRFWDELGSRCSPFGDLKCLKFDFSFFHMQKLFKGPCKSLSELEQFVPDLKGYLLNKLQDVKFAMIYPEDPKSSCSRSHASKTCKCMQRNTIKLK